MYMIAMNIVLYICRMMIVDVLICLIILTSQCVCVHSKVIIINSSSGNDSTECCVNGTCACSSLSTALLNIDNNTIINITSESVALNNTTTMGSGKLTNITITGSNVTIMCNNSGSVYCESCDDVMIEGITWDRCSDPNGTNIAGVTFNGTSNISLVNCTFQHSRLQAVALLQISDVIIEGCNFLSNIPLQMIKSIPGIPYLGTLIITRVLPEFSSSSNVTVTVRIFDSYFYDNGYLQINPNASSLLPLFIDIADHSVVNCNVTLKNSMFISNRDKIFLSINILKLINMQLIEILAFNNSFIMLQHILASSDVFLSIISTTLNGSNANFFLIGNKISVTINDSNFTDGKLMSDSAIYAPTLGIITETSYESNITFNRVEFNNNLIGTEYDITDGTAGAVSIVNIGGDVVVNMFMVKFVSNQYLGYDGGALYIFLKGNIDHNCIILVKASEFISNQSPGHGAALYIYIQDIKGGNIQIQDTIFNQNIAGNSVVYITLESFLQDSDIKLLVNGSTFINNVASSMYLSGCDVELSGIIFFRNNTAENGGAMYLNQGTRITIANETKVQFIDNTAILNGGAIYVNILCDSLGGGADTFLHTTYLKYTTMFINNSARIAGNSIYFNIPPKFCSVNKNISDPRSILYLPCQFNYSQPINGRMMNIPCDLDYTLLNGTGAPIVTSPHRLRLYFPFNDVYNILSTFDYNVYFVKNSILGEVKFTGAVFDYFGKITQPVTFSVQHQCLNISKYSVMNSNYLQYLTIDNLTNLFVNLSGRKINAKSINVTVLLTSLSYSYYAIKINATLIVELVPCYDHPGYTYNEDLQTCVCYHHNIKCYENSNQNNEIQRSYWFGSIMGTATVSLCPNHYCKFTHRKQTSESYFELPNTINAQCNDYRVGRACGECISGYTLSYDSTDCISINQCNARWTVLVITLTCLYWIAVVVGVFSLMYFNFHLSSGYLYGIIYYYSMIGVLLENNPYILDDAFQFVSILSNFAQMTPQFLGKLCLVRGLSGIDQLFIHYSHAVGVSLLLLLIVVAVRCSTRITLFVSRCIIRVICLLILLSYTSIASTSLQLLLPLRFTDVKERYAYASPNIQYFHGRHAIYGIVAIICELVVVGLSLLLLLEPVLSRKINFIRIKPLLDQFQGCYEDKYRWFAAYYLICRQVLFLIVYIFNSNYYNMLFYLQTACVVIAVIHMWFQPYQNKLLNALDGVMLLVMVLVVNINTFTFLHDATTEISLILVVLPLLLFCAVAVKKIIVICFEKKYRMESRRSHACHYRQIDIADDSGENEKAGESMILR